MGGQRQPANGQVLLYYRWRFCLMSLHLLDQLEALVNFTCNVYVECKYVTLNHINSNIRFSGTRNCNSPTIIEA